jgi:hypothetical protein
MARRFPRVFAACCLLGIAATVAIAWILGLTVQPAATSLFIVYDGAAVWQVNQATSFGAARAEWFAMVVFAPDDSPQRRTTVLNDFPHLDKPGPKPRALSTRPVNRGREGTPIRHEHSRGWPMRALWCEWIPPANPGAVPRPGSRAAWAGAIPIGTADHFPFPVRLAALPLRPIWHGFAVNALFYAALSAALLVGVSHLRCLTRRRRGQCTRCGYDRRGIVGGPCPECGMSLA